MAQFGSDTFTGTEGDVLSTYSASWTLHTSTTVASEIASGAVRGSAAGASMYYHSGTPANQDYSVTADLIYKSTPTGYAAGPVARVSTSAATFYFGRHVKNDGSFLDRYEIYKFVAGTPTLLNSFNASLAANKTLKLQATGTTTTELVLYVDTVSTVTYSDSSSPITAAGKAGIRFGYGGSNTPSDTTLYHLDNFSADDVASGVTGTGSLTTSEATASGTGTIGHTGTGTPTTNAVTAFGTGVISHTGTGSPTTSTTTASGTGTVTSGITGTGAIAVGAVTASGAGTLAHTGTGAATVGAVTASGAGTLSHTGTGAPTTSSVTASGAGTLSHTGTGAITVGNTTVSGSPGVTGTGAITNGNVTVSGTGTRIGWDVVSDASGSWSDVAANSDGWSIVANASGSWTVQ